MTTTNDAGTLREKITEIVLGVHEAGYYFGSIGERDARNPYTAPEDTADEILAAVAESMLSDEAIYDAGAALLAHAGAEEYEKFGPNEYWLGEGERAVKAALTAAGITEREE
jgi:hypothetical protein